MSDSRIEITHPGTDYASLTIKSKWNELTVDSIFVNKETGIIGHLDIGMVDTTHDGSYLNVYLNIEEAKQLVAFIQHQIDRVEKIHKNNFVVSK